MNATARSFNQVMTSHPTLDRYVGGMFFRNFLVSVFATVAIFLFQQLLGDLYDHQYPAGQIIFYHLLNIPQIVVQMAAPSVLMATVLTLSGLARSAELIACYSIGISLKRIVTLIILIVFIISCMILVLEDRVLPPTFKKRTTYFYRDMEKKTDFFLDIKQDKIWYRSKNMIYNLQRFDPLQKTIYGMSVYTFDDDFNLVQVVDAQRAEYGASGWRLMDGTVTLFSPDETRAEDEFPKTQQFKEKELLIDETPRDFQEIDKEVEGLRLKELWKYIKRSHSAGADTKSYEVTFHSRISLSFIPLVMCILGVPFSTRTRREGGVAKDLGLCLVLTFFYWIFFSVGLSLGRNGAVPPVVAAWLPSMVFLMMATFLVVRQRK